MSDRPAYKGRPPKGKPLVLPDGRHVCGAKRRDGSLCLGTPCDNGRCKHHGGKSPKRSLTALYADVSHTAAFQFLARLKKNLEDVSNADLLRGMDVGAKYTLAQRVQVEQLSVDRLTDLAKLTAGYIEESRFDEWFQAAVSILLPQSAELNSLRNSDTEM